MMDRETIDTLQAGPCVICGGTNYDLSCGGPTICPKCDCGNFDAATVETQAKVIIALREELRDFQQTFDLQWEADMRAVRRWREAHPGNDLVMPDRANMVVWLLEQHDALVATPAVQRGREVLLPPWVGGEDPLPRCEHDNCLRDGGGEILEPSCGCRGRAATPAVGGEREALQKAIDSAFGEKGLRIDWQLRNAVVDKIIATCSPRAQPASPLRGRGAVIEECAKIAEATGLRNPANIARDIRALSASPPEQPAIHQGNQHGRQG